jgi:hypothetical protein
MSTQLDEARRVAISLLDDLEGGSASVEGVLMKAKRLARLMRDADAQTWLDLETRGYPADLNTSRVHRIPPHVRDDRDTSQVSGRDGDANTSNQKF